VKDEQKNKKKSKLGGTDKGVAENEKEVNDMNE